ncbi:MAG: acyl-CoA dehydrogenase, partial [Rickettsiales bacterium]
GSLKDKLTSGIYLPEDKGEVLGRLENAVSLYEKTLKSRDRIKLSIKNKKLPKKPIKLLLDDALRNNIISQYEFDMLKESESALYDSILVDDYKVSGNNVSDT